MNFISIIYLLSFFVWTNIILIDTITQIWSLEKAFHSHKKWLYPRSLQGPPAPWIPGQGFALDLTGGPAAPWPPANIFSGFFKFQTFSHAFSNMSNSMYHRNVTWCSASSAPTIFLSVFCVQNHPSMHQNTCRTASQTNSKVIQPKHLSCTPPTHVGFILCRLLIDNDQKLDEPV